jgi:Xaa-Pro dipeptidase
MEVLDVKGLSERLRWEDNEYWLHLEAETPFEKYPGKLMEIHVGRESS